LIKDIKILSILIIIDEYSKRPSVRLKAQTPKIPGGKTKSFGETSPRSLD
jgi:hypothetical protein